MELTIREKKATICLNMIVKNESHIIENTLEKLCKKISFDYWVICDTGSTDNTPQIITKFFEKRGIKGEIYYDEWRDFAHNRTLALERAYRKTDLLLVFDADDEIVGNVIIPTEVLCDEYHMKFGSASGTSYTRVLLINNHKKFKFLSVLHEFITCIDGSTSSKIIEGDYYVVSGRTGSRNMDPNKYLKDALVLEKAHAEALKNDDHLFHRYAYYCANSYKDCGRFEDAIKWYKITLSQEKQWDQEKYTACLYIYDCYKALNQETNGFFYLVKAFSYDKERVECLYPLLVHYCCENHKLAYNYYLNVKDFFENQYLNADMSRKLFTIPDKYNFFLPYYMILIADKVQDFECVVRMYEIVFIKKQPMFEEWYVKNLLYNLHFFLHHVPKDNKHFSKLANDYIAFLFANGVKLQSFDFLTKDEYIKHGINLETYSIKEVTLKSQKFSKNECANSKNILIYTGFSDIEWNYTYMLNNALGGSEKAVAYISKCFPKDFNIFISGHVKNEIIDNIQYIHLNELPNLCERTPFHTVIVSRYIGFYEMFKTSSFYQSFIWAHDTLLLPYGSNLNETHILKKWNKYINGCVCLTEWHKTIFSERYPDLKNKITLINNGLDLTSFPTTGTNNILKNNKIKNKFIYTSRPDRGLNILLQLWPQIIDIIPDATLTISTYGNFPSNLEEVTMKTIIESTPSIHYLGKLNVEQLYLEMSSSEFWLYPTHWPETSCITALEMLMSEVICLYYPVAGLPFTIDKYGIQIKPGSEIEAIVSLTDVKKCELRQNGREYAEQCSWSNRYKLWSNLILDIKESDEHDFNKTVNKTIIYTSDFLLTVIEDYYIGLSEKNIELSSDINHIIKIKPSTIIFIGTINNNEYILFKTHNPFCKIGLLNLEPLNLQYRLTEIIKNYDTYKPRIYDYSLSNIKILNQNGINNVNFLPYISTNYEINYLKELYTASEKKYDFGILTGCGAPNNSISELGPKRKKIVEFLLSKGFTVNIIKAWNIIRDTELAKCKVILNIHGQLLTNNQWFDSNIFEHLRCDRLLNAGFTILSEKSYSLDEDFIKKYPNLQIIDYIDFFKEESYSKFSLSFKNNTNIDKKNYCFIHSCNLENVGTGRLEQLIKKIEESNCINILEKIYIINIGIPIPIEHNYGDKYIITNYSTDPQLYEGPTINKIIDFSSDNNDCNILYIHTKGIRYNVMDEKENDWIDLMLYFLLDKHKECIEKLNEHYDTVGCNYYCKENPYILPHFSGNFWWANTNYLKKNQKINESLKDRSSPEFWLFKSAPLYHTIFNSQINHYVSRYPKQIYENINKIIDCFTFYNELNMLNYRLNVLNSVVDYFIIVEAKQTHVGNPKKLFYDENKEMFEKFHDKIIHIVVDLPFNESNINISNGDQWTNEKFQRNCIQQGLEKIKHNLNDNDHIVIADVDEIPDPKRLLQIRNKNLNNDINVLEQEFYYYNLNSKRNEFWYHCKTISYKKYRELNVACNDIRFINGTTVKNGGWHLSYFGDTNFIKNKLQNFAHQEYNSSTFTDTDKISEKINNGLDLFNRDANNVSNSMKKISIVDNKYLPPLFETYLKEFY